MPRSKQTPKRGARPVKVRLGSDDTLPVEFVESLLSLPSPVEKQPGSSSELLIEDFEPPSKKIRLSAPVDSHLLTSLNLCFDFPGEVPLSPPLPIVREDIGEHVKMSLLRGNSWDADPSDDWLLGLLFSKKATGRNDLFTDLALKSKSVDKKLDVCLDVHQANEPRSLEGALWTKVDMRLEQDQDLLRLDICLHLYWNTTESPYSLRSKKQRKISEQVLSWLLPISERGNTDDDNRTTWTPLDFYEAAHVPPADDEVSESISVPGLTASLYPYQKRTLRWLLNREGVEWIRSDSDSSPPLRPINPAVELSSAFSFSEFQSPGSSVGIPDRRPLYFSKLHHAITYDTSQFARLDQPIKGGILAEEMGLGKTLEIIGLILLHRRNLDRETPYVNVNGDDLIRSGATLIVCPESLRQQWIEELERHAPHLMVSYYPGRGHMDRVVDGITDETELVTHLAHQDVVVTTYNVLRNEIHYAVQVPERSRRQERAYPRPKSPLVQISWWRVCLDEAQMIESGVSSAALVARVLHRVNAWGITGTPVKSDVKDLLGLLLFLRYEPYCSSPHIWSALTTQHKELFRELFNRISIRHTKRLVRNELAIPPQKRFVITMPFTAIEEQHYRSLFSEMADACGMDVEGNPVIDEWNPEFYEEDMRSWLNRLRQTALHPEVGIQNRRALGHKAGPLRTIDEVLTAMIDASDLAIRTEQRNYLNARLTHGQMLENGPRVKEALEIWQSVQNLADTIVAKCRDELAKAIFEAKQAQGAAENGEESTANTDAAEDDDDDVEESQSKGKVGEARMRLRNALETQHRAVFFCANAFFQIKSNADLTVPDSTEFHGLQKTEEDTYNAAQKIRREILSENHKKATKHMTKLRDLASSQSFVVVPEVKPNDLKGLESAPIVERVEELYGLLNLQAGLIDDWREAIIQLLLRPLVDEDLEVELTGDEFADSTLGQEHLMVYVQLLRAMIADRQTAISGLENALVRHELQTATAMAKNGEGPAPEKLLELVQVRSQMQPQIHGEIGSLRAALGALRTLLGKLPRENDAKSRQNMEHEVISRQIKDMQAQISSQTKTAQALERECEKFTSAMNARLDYYRQLQNVSDSVEPYEGPKDEAAISECIASQQTSNNKLTSLQGKHRYLLSLQDPGANNGEPRMCIICQSPFTTGVLTVCGHQFCKECIMLWFRAHHNCPMCKRHLKMAELHNITLKPRELKLHVEDTPAPEPKRSPVSKKTGIYSEFGSDKLAEINDVDLPGPSFTTKVDSIVRHILWLRESDPGAKSIIFSQYRDFLNVIGLALLRSRIGYRSIDNPQGIEDFKTDAAVECFLLHGRAQSSGLNLVNASHVFLCEPVLNTALELQAIARVDRIGQQHETTVWLYLIEGTVEESIYNLSVRRRMEHMGKGPLGKSRASTPEVLEPTLEDANTLEMEQAKLSKLMSKDRTAGEAVDKDDLWECLFGHVAKGREAEARDERMDNPAIRGLLAAEAAEERRDNGVNGV